MFADLNREMGKSDIIKHILIETLKNSGLANEYKIFTLICKM